ncbi:MAG: hypothetical protein ACI8TQ_000492 [Planctomycetota bacterium]|jgi:hypothetical protein
MQGEVLNRLGVSHRANSSIPKMEHEFVSYLHISMILIAMFSALIRICIHERKTRNIGFNFTRSRTLYRLISHVHSAG